LEQPASGGLSLTADRGSGKVLRLGLNFGVNTTRTGDGLNYAREVLAIAGICLNYKFKIYISTLIGEYLLIITIK